MGITDEENFKTIFKRVGDWVNHVLSVFNHSLSTDVTNDIEYYQRHGYQWNNWCGNIYLSNGLKLFWGVNRSFYNYGSPGGSYDCRQSLGNHFAVVVVNRNCLRGYLDCSSAPARA
ncbi:hypothetical protein GCM10011459_01610 [Limosilactobacillus caviae]|uniref:Uncharacterized protein n=1 Tax=Limosilactobacillus caviae TaxID=1769424 RepID=A0ABQ2C373_9LACO|nr:hypothetical protein GCM10011459_01610 [Limosilactobacillus caviae]